MTGLLPIYAAFSPECSRVEGVDERAIRLKLSSQLDMLGVVARTLREFGDEAVSRG